MLTDLFLNDTISVNQLSEMAGVDNATIYKRLEYGFNDKKLLMPSQKKEQGVPTARESPLLHQWYFYFVILPKSQV